ncbi:MAG: hypothetical protein EOP63_00910 [Sphingomonadales bacterium]|nr:MAG: hypothetical protein EOP63_00910 [Sphingomonadales bacterium]
MANVSLSVLFDHWPITPGAAAHGRLAALLRAAGAEADPLAADTLGARNRRLIALHDDLVGGAIEAQVACAGCATANSFVVPKDVMRALPPAAPDALVGLSFREHELTYRVSTMADIAAVGEEADLRLAMLDRCAMGSDRVPAAELDRAALEAIEARFDEIDPLANIVVGSACSGCGMAIAASVDLAAFVATDLDRLHAILLRDVDFLASAYGWSEADILALPAERRARYVAMVADRRAASPQRQRIRPI